MKEPQNSKDIFETLPVPSALKAMILPTIASQLIVLIYNMADTFFVGRVNNPYMVAGVSLILPVFNITLCLAGLAGVGGGTLISRLLGIGRDAEARKVSSFSLWLSLLTAALFSFGVAAFMEPLLLLLGAGEQTFSFARQYIACVIVAGGIPTVVTNVMAYLFRSTGRSREASIGIMLGGLLNIALDPLFMFVLLPRGSEVLGVGLATLVSNCTALVYFLVSSYKIRSRSVINFHLKYGLPERKSIVSIFFVGVPSALTSLLFDLDYVLVDRLMVSHSDIALAAIGIVLKVERLPLNVGVGICHGMLPLVAYNYSAKNYPRMTRVIQYSRALGLIVAAVSIALYELFAWYLIRFFIPDAQTVSLAVSFLRVRVLATPFMFLSFFTVYIFQAFGRGNKSLFLGVTRWAVLNIPMLFLFNRLFGMYGLVWAQFVADALNVLLCFGVYRNYIRRDPALCAAAL